MVLKPPRAFFHKSNYQKIFSPKFQFWEILIAAPSRVHTIMGSISIWDWSVMFPGAKNRFRLSGGFCWQIFLFQICSVYVFNWKHLGPSNHVFAAIKKFLNGRVVFQSALPQERFLLGFSKFCEIHSLTCTPKHSFPQQSLD